MPTGSIISFKDDRGYGFIKPEDGSANVYLHVSALQESAIAKIQVGQKVSYDIQTTDDKISAMNIKLIDAE